MNTIELENGKYKIEVDFDIPTPVFKCYRNGKEWRDLTGDKMVLALVFENLKLKNRLAVFADRRNWLYGIEAHSTLEPQPNERAVWLPNWQFGLESLPDSVLTDYTVMQVDFTPWVLADPNWKRKYAW